MPEPIPAGAPFIAQLRPPHDAHELVVHESMPVDVELARDLVAWLTYCPMPERVRVVIVPASSSKAPVL